MISRKSIASVAVLACGIACLSATVSDDFTAAGVGPAWTARAFSGGATSEVSGKLFFSSVTANANAGARDGAVAGYLCKTHKLVFTQPWTMEMDYALTLPAMVGQNSAGAGGLMQFGNPAATAVTQAQVMNGYGFYACRTAVGYRLALIQWQNGEWVDEDWVAPIAASGRIKIVYTATTDRLQVYVDNVVRKTYLGFRANYAFSPVAHFGIGGASVEDTSYFTFLRQVAIDNFTISGNGVVAGQ